MKIVWDEPKRRANLEKHRGFDFADLTVEFFEAATIVPAKNGRHMAIGEFRGETIIATVFVPLGVEAISVISMRRASRKERMLHGTEQAQGDPAFDRRRRGGNPARDRQRSRRAGGD